MGARKAQKAKTKNKKKPAASHLASHRNRKGQPPKPKHHLTDVELRFCFRRACGVSIRKAAAQLGINVGTAMGWSASRPAIQEQINAIRETRKDEILEEEREARLVDVPYIDERSMGLLNGVKKIDSDAVRLLDILYKSTGVIQTHAAPRVLNDARANPDAPSSAGMNMIDVYEADWLRKKKAKWTKELEQKHPTPAGQ